MVSRKRRTRNPMSEAERKALVAGILVGEGSPTCVLDKRVLSTGEVRHYCYPMLFVGMCDRKAVEHVASEWGTTVGETRRRACRPTPQNPHGRLYYTRKMGAGAIEAVETYRPYIEGTEFLRKWERALNACHPTRGIPRRPRRSKR